MRSAAKSHQFGMTSVIVEGSNTRKSPSGLGKSHSEWKEPFWGWAAAVKNFKECCFRIAA